MAAARPIPEVAPVTIATLSCNSFMIVLPFGVHCYCSYVLFLFFCFSLFSWARALRFSSKAGVVIEFNGANHVLMSSRVLLSWPTYSANDQQLHPDSREHFWSLPRHRQVS